MRVLICSDRMGSMSSAAAGRALASGWPGAAVRTAGEAGREFVEATADGWSGTLHTTVLDGAVLQTAVSRSGEVAMLGISAGGPVALDSSIPYGASSAILGRAIHTVLGQCRPRRLLVDLAGLDVHDAGAGLLAALGASATGADLSCGVTALAGLAAVDLGVPRTLLAGIKVVGVVPSAQRADQLLGLRGITSRRGHAAGEDPAVLLATDDALQQLTEAVAPQAARAPGAGACGGLGWAILALGGRLTTGPEVGLAGTGRAFDLVVTGCGVFDFASRGGGVVATVAELAAEALAPCILIAGEVLVGAREMRTMGIEAAYGIRESRLDRPTGGDLTETELVAAVSRVSRSWRW